jgi:DNA-binding LacI/PurR family transcriptional regulator
MARAPEPPGLFDEVLKGEFVTDRLRNDLREQIESMKLPPGTLIRPVRELMKQYRISYNSVRKALNQLAKEGYVALEQGRGTFVRGRKVPRPLGSQDNVINSVNDDSKSDSVRVEEGHSVDESPPPGSLDRSAQGDAGEVTPAEDESARELKVNQSGVRTRWPKQPVFKGAMVSPPSSVGEGSERDSSQSCKTGPRSVCVWIGEEVLGGGAPGLEVGLHAFQTAALTAGWSVTIASATSVADDITVEGRFCVVWGAVDVQRLRMIMAGCRACLVVGSWPSEGVFSAVVPDYFMGASELVRRMVRAGHRRFAFLYDTARVPGSASAERWAGLQVALQEAGLDVSPQMALECPAGAEWLADRILSLKPHPTAILVSEQAMAERLIVQLTERGVCVPNGMSVACFGVKGESNPLDISSARVDWSSAGTCVLSRLRELLSGRSVERLRIGLPVEIHPGSTVG